MTADSIIEKNVATLHTADIFSHLIQKRFTHNPATQTTRQILTMEVNGQTGEIVSIEETYDRFIEDPMRLISVTAQHSKDGETTLFQLILEDREPLSEQACLCLDATFSTFIPNPE